MGDQPPFVVVLGIAQDGGRPQAGCRRPCCVGRPKLSAACLAVVDPSSRQRWIIDATPDIAGQLSLLDQIAGTDTTAVLDGVLLTHAHMGHYAGLVHVGREALATSSLPVYARPRMSAFLRTNSPWRDLSDHGHVSFVEFDDSIELSPSVSMTAVAVPHRDELSDTVGFIVRGPNRRILWLPDIDGWDAWDRDLVDVVDDVDVAYLDGTFFDDGELERDMTSIPHPRVVDTLTRLESDRSGLTNKVRFIHLNHTNPVLDHSSSARRRVEAAGATIAAEGEIQNL